MAKNETLYIIKSTTYKGRWVTSPYSYGGRKEKNVYAERYLGMGERRIIQMNGINYDRKKLLIFKDKKSADNACKCANAILKKLEVYGEHGSLELNEYRVIEYKPRKPISDAYIVPMFGGTAYMIRE